MSQKNHFTSNSRRRFFTYFSRSLPFTGTDLTEDDQLTEEKYLTKEGKLVRIRKDILDDADRIPADQKDIDSWIINRKDNE